MIDSAENFQSTRVLGVRVHIVDLDRALNTMEEWIREQDTCRIIVATGMHGVMEARKSADFKAMINSADLFLPDGISLVWTARLRGQGLTKRVCGADLMWEFCKLADLKGYRVFFYGDTEETLGSMSVKLKEKFPGLQIAGLHSPPFRPLTPDEDEEVMRIINNSGADVVWVGLGLPKQERWMFDHRERLNVPILVGVGAAFKFISGRESRAPKWLGDRGGEWLWRLLHKPRRVWRRVLVDGPRFVYHVILEQSGIKKYD